MPVGFPFTQNGWIESFLKNVFHKLKTTWDFHPWFIYRMQIPYLSHLIYVAGTTFPSESLNYDLKIAMSDVYRLFKTILLIVRWRIRNKAQDYRNEVIVTGYKRNESEIGGKKVNIYTVPFDHILKESGVSALYFFLDGVADLYNKRSIKLYQYYKYLTVYYEIVFKLRCRFSQSHKKHLNNVLANEWELNAWLKANQHANSDAISLITRNAIIRNQVMFNVFNHLIEYVNPKLIWTYCFYDNNISAFARAARMKNVKFVDYQHSQQSDMHFAYAPWNDIDKVIDFLPSIFWVWSNADKERLLNNFGANGHKPTVINGGNLYLSLKGGDNRGPKPQKSVLVSLQGQWIPNFIEEFIKSEPNFYWYFRLHPRYSQDKVQLLRFKDEYPDKIELDESNSLPLYDLFDRVAFNITAYSGVAIEANEFGVKNIVYSDKGYQVYKDYIEGGVFEHVNDESTLRLALTNSQNRMSVESIIRSQENIALSINKLLMEAGIRECK
jgi:hypothetical protein